MTGRFYRTQILLEPEQHQVLAAMAAQEGRSISELVREIIRQHVQGGQQVAPQTEGSAVSERIEGIWSQYRQERERASTGPPRDHLAVLARIRQHQEAMMARRGGQPVDFDVVEEIHRMRDERDAEILASFTGDCA